MCIMDHNMAFTNKTALVSQGLSEALGFKAHNHELNSDMVAKQLEHLKEKAWRSPRGFRQQEKNEDSLADFVPDHTCPCDMVKKVVHETPPPQLQSETLANSWQPCEVHQNASEVSTQSETTRSSRTMLMIDLFLVPTRQHNEISCSTEKMVRCMVVSTTSPQRIVL